LGLRDASVVQAACIGQPALGEVEAEVQGVVACGADVVDRDRDLAVGLLAQGPPVLPLHAHGVLPLFGEGDIVKEQDGLGVSEGLAPVGAVAAQDLALVPGALIDELRQGLLGVLAGQALRQDHSSGQRLDALPLAIEQEALQVDAGPAGRLGLRKVCGEQRGVVAEAVEDGRIEFGSVGLHTSLDARDCLSVTSI
jgi:hypothetical protein